jgi:uncharacterized coiled-coil protein SlyX
MVFTCPHCKARFQAAIMQSPKAYRCPHCKNPFTINPDGDVQKGDRTKPRQTIEPVRPPSEVFFEGAAQERSGSGEPFDELKAEDERELYKEVLEQFKELTSRQRCLEETDNQALEIKKLRRENEKLMGQIFSLEERLGPKGALTGNTASMRHEGSETDSVRSKHENDELRSIVEGQRKGLDENESIRLELLQRIDRLEMELKDAKDRRGQELEPAQIRLRPEDVGFGQSKAETLEDEAKRIDLWKKELDAYKSNLEEIALSFVREKEDIERRTVVLAARERSLDGLADREGKVAELERALLAKEEELRQHLRSASTESPSPGTMAMVDEQAGGKEHRITEREAAVKRVEDLLDSRKKELSILEAALARRGNELSMREAALKELDRSLSERQESLEKARDKLRELKERMHKELGSRKGQDDARSKQKELKEKLESKQAGFQEMETKIKDLLK